MRFSDLYPGIVYAYRQTRQSAILPLVLLTQPTDGEVFTDQGFDNHYGAGKGDKSAPYFARCSGAPVPRKAGRPGIGYPAVTLHGSYVFSESGRARAISTMPQVTLTDFSTVTYDQDPARALHFILLTRPQVQILGKYDEVIAEERQKAQYRQGCLQVAQDTLVTITDELSALEISYAVRREDGIPVGVELSLDDMVRLIGKITPGDDA